MYKMCAINENNSDNILSKFCLKIKDVAKCKNINKLKASKEAEITRLRNNNLYSTNVFGEYGISPYHMCKESGFDMDEYFKIVTPKLKPLFKKEVVNVKEIAAGLSLGEKQASKLVSVIRRVYSYSGKAKEYGVYGVNPLHISKLLGWSEKEFYDFIA